MSDEAKSQDDVLAFLADPATYDGGGEAVKRIDTHAASVFLTEDRVLKVKRAVKFPFLDYSTLEKRKGACEAELKVNAPYAPEIYRGVSPSPAMKVASSQWTAAASRSNGRLKCAASTRIAPSIT